MTISITGRVVSSPEERNRLFSTYVEPHIESIRRLVASLTYDGEDADDNLQDVLLVLLNAIVLYNPAKAGFTRWLDRVVRNAMADIHRRTQRDEPMTSLDVLLESSDADDAADTADTLKYTTPPALVASAGQPSVAALCVVAPAEAAARSAAPAVAPPLVIDRDDYPSTYDALMSLPALQRRALLLRAEGWSCSEVADELRLTEVSVRKMLSRARAVMARRLQPPRARLACI